MTAHVISHHGVHRKRAFALAWRRFGVFSLAVAAVAVGTWLAPRLVETPLAVVKTPAPTIEAEPPKGEVGASALKPLEFNPMAPLPRAAPQRQRPRTAAAVPLDAETGVGDDYEVLSAAELDGISQARAEDGASQFAPAPQAATTAAEELAGARESVNVEDQSGQSRRRTRRR